MYRDEERRFDLVVGSIVSLLAAAAMPSVIAGTFVSLISPSITAGIFLFAIAFAYAFVVSLAHVLVLGLPVFLLGWRLRAIRWWSTLIAAFIVGAIPMAIWTWPDLSSLGWRDYVSGFAFFGLFGVSGGIVFSLLWHYWIRPEQYYVIEQKTPSGNAAGFQTQQDDVFGRIADRYDLLCDLFSFGVHRLWKRRVAGRIAQEPWLELLDAASGTGDVVLRVAQRDGIQPHQHVIVSDISPQMLAVARRRAAGLPKVLDFRVLDAHSMPDIPDGSIDLYSISLGLKICDRAKVMQEAMRVLRPGGRLITLEASTIVWPWVQQAYLAYMQLCVPIIGWVATGGDASAYRYLLKGIREFPAAAALAAEMESLGFEDVSFERLSFGIAAIHTARKPHLEFRAQ
jgi:demethylmenaquinone methyltransferase / 2-methoxy-6-polyprenyl-1,4-benzoquinol methylase